MKTMTQPASPAQLPNTKGIQFTRSRLGGFIWTTARQRSKNVRNKYICVMRNNTWKDVIPAPWEDQRGTSTNLRKQLKSSFPGHSTQRAPRSRWSSPLMIVLRGGVLKKNDGIISEDLDFLSTPTTTAKKIRPKIFYSLMKKRRTRTSALDWRLSTSPQGIYPRTRARKNAPPLTSNRVNAELTFFQLDYFECVIPAKILPLQARLRIEQQLVFCFPMNELTKSNQTRNVFLSSLGKRSRDK